ncbi:TolC family protein [Polaromonas sp.]|uniref:TolC family protein n=1 Tax=Polaromonas sp. TaxID=1869339 RepID=UPI002FC6D4FD
MNTPSTHCLSSTLRRSGSAMLLLIVAGCATVSPDGGVADLEQLTAGKTIGSATGTTTARIARPGVDSAAAVADLLKAPLTADAAVRVALLNNPGLQVALASSGVNISDAVSASNQAKRQAQQDITLLSAQARKAWVNAVAASQTARYMADVKAAAEAGGELARRMARVGNWSKLQQAREQALLADATAQLARARQTAFSEREKLVLIMGLWGAQTRFELPDQLPDLPQQALEIPDIEARALQERLDVRLATAQWQALQAKPRESGPDGLWDGMRDSARVREVAIKARSEAREAYHGYRTAYDLARHYRDEVVPLRKFINDEMMLRYNGMLASVWDLLADTRAQVMSVNSAIEAQRDFWLAEADLQTLLAGASPGALAGLRPGATANGPAPAAH